MNTFTDYLANNQPFTYMVKVDGSYRFFFRDQNEIAEIQIKRIDRNGKEILLNTSDHKTALKHLNQLSEKKRAFCLFSNVNIATVMKQAGGYCSALILDCHLKVTDKVYPTIEEACRESHMFLKMELAPCFVPNVLMPTTTIVELL